ncbi:MAG: YggS family pyridoxal phosphate-dependent enzyme [Burkholderiaceae bacterium]|jgi:pyridoxal phosphate enzyme (YggS family)
MSAIASNLQDVLQRIETATIAAGRTVGKVALIAVTKTFPVEAIEQAFAAGQRAFGENYVQEALDKIAYFREHPATSKPVEWHMIGPIQTNKTRAIAEHFDWVHSIDRLRVAERLSEQRPSELGPLNVCLQVNISAEASKSGVAPEQLPQLAGALCGLPGIRLRGLMAIPQPQRDPTRSKESFARVRILRDALLEMGLPCEELSMGMSADLEAAIAEGATMVRVGTAIFGARHAS